MIWYDGGGGGTQFFCINWICKCNRKRILILPTYYCKLLVLHYAYCKANFWFSLCYLQNKLIFYYKNAKVSAADTRERINHSPVFSHFSTNINLTLLYRNAAMFSFSFSLKTPEAEDKKWKIYMYMQKGSRQHDMPYLVKCYNDITKQFWWPIGIHGIKAKVL